MKRRDLRYLHYLIFRRGGVAGAIKRIVIRWRGPFTSGQICGQLLRKYPLLVPADTQVGDCLEAMERRNFVERILENANAIFYKLAPFQLWFNFSRR